jgi:hypothetical protein
MNQSTDGNSGVRVYLIFSQIFQNFISSLQFFNYLSFPS